MAVVNGVCTRSTLCELLGWGLGSCQTSSASRPAPGWNRRRWTFHTQKNNRLTLTADTVPRCQRQRVSAGMATPSARELGVLASITVAMCRPCSTLIVEQCVTAFAKQMHGRGCSTLLLLPVLVQLNGAAAVHARMRAVTVNDSLQHAGTQF